MLYHDWIKSKDEVPSVKGLNKRQRDEARAKSLGSQWCSDKSCKQKIKEKSNQLKIRD